MIRFALSRNRRTLLKLAALSTTALFLIAATDVTNELMQRPGAQREALSQISAWESDITFELPPTERGQWRQVAEEMPVLLLKSCSALSTQCRS